MSPRLTMPERLTLASRPYERHTIPGVRPVTPLDTHKMPLVYAPRKTPAALEWTAGDLTGATTPFIPARRFYACEEHGCTYWMSEDESLTLADESEIEEAVRKGLFWRKP